MTKGAPSAQTPHVNLLLRNQATVREIVSELLSQLTLGLRKWNHSQKHRGGKRDSQGASPTRVEIFIKLLRNGKNMGSKHETLLEVEWTVGSPAGAPT